MVKSKFLPLLVLELRPACCALVYLQLLQANAVLCLDRISVTLHAASDKYTLMLVSFAVDSSSLMFAVFQEECYHFKLL
jgi:hypothetical protein